MIHAPDFPAHATWLNTNQALSLKKLRGHIVLLDFWTYCCINCIHILPDLKAIEEKFSDQPVVLIGVHAAKFLNEQKVENIQSAINRYEIKHPVLVDNQHQVWDEYAVRAWPTFVLIDAEGNIRGQASGEGHCEALSQAIAELLKEGQEKKVLAEKPLQLSIPHPPANNTLSFPGKIAFDPTGKRLAISDSNHNRILITGLTSPLKAKIIHVIGTGQVGHQDGNFSETSFNHPQGLLFHEDHLFVADTENHLVRDIDLKAIKVTTLTGTGQQSAYGASGGRGVDTALSSPWDLAIHSNQLYIAMAGNHQIWKYDFKTQKIEVFAGNGAENIVDNSRLRAQLAQTSGLSSTPDALYFADSETSAIRSLDWQTGEVKTLVGHGLFVFGHQDGPFDKALLQHCLGVYAEAQTIFVADTYNHAIRKLDLAQNQVSTLLKRENKDSCMIGDKSCAILPLAEPNDVKKQGDLLYIADTNNHLIRAFNLKTQELLNVQLTES